MSLRGTARAVKCPECGAPAGVACFGTERNSHWRRSHLARRVQEAPARKAIEEKRRLALACQIVEEKLLEVAGAEFSIRLGAGVRVTCSDGSILHGRDLFTVLVK